MNRSNRFILWITLLVGSLIALLFSLESTRAGGYALLLFGPKPIKRWAIEKLRRSGYRGAAALGSVAADRSESQRTRLGLLYHLSIMKRRAAPAFAAVVTLLDDPDPELKLSALRVLEAMGPAAIEARPELTATLNDSLASVRAAALLALAAQGPQAIPELRRGLRDPDAQVRQSAAFGLYRLGPEAADAIPDLIAAHNSGRCPGEALRALVNVGGAEATLRPLINEALKSRDPLLRRCAEESLFDLDHRKRKPHRSP